MGTRLLLLLLLGPPVAWAGMALAVDGPLEGRAATAVGVGAAALGLAVLVALRPPWRAALLVALGLAAVIAWWLSIPPRQDRDWMPDVARLPRSTLTGSALTIENVRDFRYRSESDFDAHWERRTYDLGALEGVDFYLSYWGSPHIAHTIVSWVFADGPPLAISIETRKERGESYSALLGFFRQYELYYVVADERDVVRLRTDVRGEEVYRYRVRMPPERARAILLDYMRSVNRLAERPDWYNALTHNCTTTIRRHVQHVAPENPWSWKILANGHLDELGWQRGTFPNELPFAEERARARVAPSPPGETAAVPRGPGGAPPAPPSASGLEPPAPGT